MLSIETVREYLTNWLNENDSDISIYDILHTKIEGDKVISIEITHPNGINIDDCVFVCREIDRFASLEDESFANGEYFFEVVSAGAERELRGYDEVLNSVGSHVYIKTTENIEKVNEFQGELIECENNTLTLKTFIKGRPKKYKIPYDLIKFIRLAVKV